MPAFSISIDVGLVDHPAGIDDALARDRVIDVVERRAAEDTGADRGNDLTGIDDGGHGEARLRFRNRHAVTMQSCATSTRRRVR